LNVVLTIFLAVELAGPAAAVGLVVYYFVRLRRDR